MGGNELQKYLEANVDRADPIYGPQCRCSVTLTDGLVLPCVILRQAAPTVDLALHRFDDEKHGKGVFGKSKKPYQQIVRHFVTSGSSIDDFYVQSVDPSPFALPSEVMSQIKGETMMGWTGWVFEMSDGSVFSYGSSFSFDFFELPDGYTFGDVAKVHNHSFVNSDGQVASIHEDRAGYLEKRGSDDLARTYQARPSFVCYVDSRTRLE